MFSFFVRTILPGTRAVPGCVILGDWTLQTLNHAPSFQCSRMITLLKNQVKNFPQFFKKYVAIHLTRKCYHKRQISLPKLQWTEVQMSRKRRGTPGFCSKCDRPSEFNSPDYLCRFCWADWWSYGDKHETKMTLKRIGKRYGNLSK